MDKGLYYDEVVDTKLVRDRLTRSTRQELIEEIVSLREQVESLKGTVSRERYYRTIEPMRLSAERDAIKEHIAFDKEQCEKHGIEY